MEILFTCLMAVIFLPLIKVAIRMSWGFFKVCAILVFLPVIIVFAFIKGIIMLLIPFGVIALVIYFIYTLLK